MKRLLLAAMTVMTLAGSVRAATNETGSVYDLGHTWTNQDGKAVNMTALRGRPRVVAMFFSTCTYACPRITADLKAIANKLTAAQRREIDFALFSFDADGDQPPALRKFAQRNQLDAAHWTLMHGPEAQVRELAAVLGINYRREADGSFSHGNAITVLDRDGGIVFQQVGLGADPTGTLEALSRLVRP